MSPSRSGGHSESAGVAPLFARRALGKNDQIVSVLTIWGFDGGRRGTKGGSPLQRAYDEAMRPFDIAVLLAALGVLAPGRALAADWYVDASGAAGGDGSMAKPFTTINGALGGLQRGDTVWIASGTYSETVNFWMLPGSGGRTTIRAMPGATPVIDGTSGSASAGYVLQAGTPDMTFQGLAIQNSSADGIEIYQADGGQVIDCTTTWDQRQRRDLLLCE